MTSRPLSTRLWLAVASAGSVGFIPFAPGTFGTAVAVPLWYVLRLIGSPLAEPLAIVVLFVVGALSARAAERALGVEDPGVVVIDEVVGFLVSVLWLPLNWKVALFGFVAFRIFDITKPFPARRLEDVPQGWGVMLDDVAAGVWAYAAARLVMWLKPEWLA
jgi:phosphatidylglycerophosphatase A